MMGADLDRLTSGGQTQGLFRTRQCWTEERVLNYGAGLFLCERNNLFLSLCMIYEVILQFKKLSLQIVLKKNRVYRVYSFWGLLWPVFFY